MRWALDRGGVLAQGLFVQALLQQLQLPSQDQDILLLARQGGVQLLQRIFLERDLALQFLHYLAQRP